MTDLVIVKLVSHDGVHPTFVEISLCRTPTRPPSALEAVGLKVTLRELRTAYAADRAREESALARSRPAETCGWRDG